MILLRKFSVRTRLLAALLFVSIIPAVLVGLFAYRVYTDSIIRERTASAMQTIQQLDSTLSVELMRYAQFIDQVSVAAELQKLPEGPMNGDILKREINTILVRDGYFRNLWVMDQEGRPLYNDGRILIRNENNELLRNADAASPADSLYYVDSLAGGNLIIGRKIFQFPLGEQHIGYIFAFINGAMLDKRMLDSISFEGSIALMSADGTVLAGNMAEPGTRLPIADLDQQLRREQRSFITELEGVSTLVVFSRNTYFDAWLLAAIPLSYMNEEAAQIGLWLALVILAVAVLCMLLSMWIYRSIAAPVNRIVAKCQGTSENRAGAADDSPDELGFLSRAVDHYMADLEALTRTRLSDQRRKRELELESLQYQINPHFLFNTLGTLKWVAIINESPPVVSEGIASLAELLRSVLLNKDEMVSIREELDNLAHYFTIQKIRYGECFKVVNEIDGTMVDSQIPRFILQPLAENAILHGTAGGRRRIVITIRCIRVPEGTLLEVQDDGDGFNPEILRSGPDHKFSGIGLSNVDERLKLYFGAAYRLDIRSRPGEGTVCRVLVPDAEPEPGELPEM